MAYYLVEDVESKAGSFTAAKEADGHAETSTKTLALSLWRCGHCRALACGMKDVAPVGKCGKCHQ